MILKNCTFKVSASGRERVRREKKKNVHAWIQGEKIESLSVIDCRIREVTYNPYKHESFVFVNSFGGNPQKVEQVDFVWLTADKKVFAFIKRD
jgi:hypothetical protein